MQCIIFGTEEEKSEMLIENSDVATCSHFALWANHSGVKDNSE